MEVSFLGTTRSIYASTARRSGPQDFSRLELLGSFYPPFERALKVKMSELQIEIVLFPRERDNDCSLENTRM